MNDFQLSNYQIAILDWIRTGRGHAVAEAVAGSGKTFTLVECAKNISGAGLFVAFNKHIAETLQDKLSGTPMTARTVHSLGYGAIRWRYKDASVETSKYRDMIQRYEKEIEKVETLRGRKLTTTELGVYSDEGFPYVTVMRLIDLARLNLSDASDKDLRYLVDHHGMDLSPDLEGIAFESVRLAMEEGKANPHQVDFTDMVWLPIVLDLSPKRYPWVFVDEAQDLSRAQLALVRRAVTRGGRVLAVGDRKQSIFAFAGADSRSFQNVIDKLEAKVFPLSVCYRCPTSHLELARELCPQIEAAPGAIPGEVRTVKRGDVVGEIQEGDLILCRVNAPLLGLCYELLSDGISASVRGRDIGAGLCKTVDDCAKLGPFSDFLGNVAEWHHDQAQRILARTDDEDIVAARLSTIEDKAECVRIIFARTRPSTVEGLKDEIMKLFDVERPSVVLSSVHRAKGLEEDRVFILEPELLRRPRGRKQWQLEQERNLHYVATTRAKQTLTFIEGK